MAKKQTTTLLIIAAGAAAAWYYFKNKGTGTETIKEAEDTATTEKETADAAVTAPSGQFAQALEKAQEVAANIKDAVVAVKSGSKTAVVRSGKKKKKKCPKVSKADIAKICEGLKGKELRKCKRKNRRSCTIIEKTQSETFNPAKQWTP